MDKILRNKVRQPFTRLVRPCATVMLAIVTVLLCLISGSVNSAVAAGLSKRLNHLSYLTPTNTTDPFNMDLNDNGNAEKHITCYPNPAISYINFKFDKSVPKDARLFVFSFTGKKMDELAITGSVQKITLDKYYRGLYVYQLRSAGGAILESGKFQVKN